MTGSPDLVGRCPNGHPSFFAGQRFCEICRAAIDPPPAVPPPAVPPAAVPPAAGAPPQFVPGHYAPPPSPYWSGQPPMLPSVPLVASPVAWPAAQKRGRSGRLLALGVLVVALAAGGAFVLIANPFGGGTPGPAAGDGVAAVPTATPGNPTPTKQPASVTAPSSSTPATTPADTAPADTAAPTRPGPTPTVSPTEHDVVPTPDPTSPFPYMSMNWLSPDPDARLTKPSLELSASGGSTIENVDVTAVRFSAIWQNSQVPLCEATVADENGIYACTADLQKAGVPAGHLVLFFDVVDSTGTITEAPAGTLPVEFAVVPPKPTQAKIAVVSDTPASDGSGSTLVEKVTWSAPDGAATEFRLYAVTYCPNDSPSAKDGTPCLTPGTPLTHSKLKLVKKVDGHTRSMTVSHVIPEGLCGATLWCDQTYALVLGAYNEYGQSVFAIVKSVDICHTCTF